jgi:hypothetical protein
MFLCVNRLKKRVSNTLPKFGVTVLALIAGPALGLAIGERLIWESILRLFDI